MVRFYSLLILLLPFLSSAQIKWQNVDSLYAPLPKSVHVYFTDQKLDTGAFRAFYVIADLKDRGLEFTTDTTSGRRLTPSQFFIKNRQPLVVVNGTFFSFETNKNLNLVIQNGKILSPNVHMTALKGRDTLRYAKFLPSAIGISKKRKADVAWTFANENSDRAVAFQEMPRHYVDSFADASIDVFAPNFRAYSKREKRYGVYKWKMRTAIGGGPVLIHADTIRITNNEERKFSGRAINDKHPRTAMGYTGDNKLIILVVEGRNPDASGATLLQLAQILKELGCVEALNLDGGGSSCLLVNGKETIKPSDKNQRAIPAVFMIMRGK